MLLVHIHRINKVFAMDPLLQSSLVLMLVGISTVFAFLILLKFVIQLSSPFVQKLSFMMPDPVPPAPKKPAAMKSDAEIALAIAAALRAAGK